MNTYKLSVTIGVLFLAAAPAFMYVEPSADIEAPADTSPSADSKPRADLPSSKKNDAADKNTDLAEVVGSSGRAQSLLWKKLFHPVTDIAPAGEVLDPDIAWGRLSELVLAASRGDSTAALSLHQLVSLCAEPVAAVSLLECQTIPKSVRQDPLQWLLLAAQLDDPRASLPLVGAARDALITSTDKERVEYLRNAAVKSTEKSTVQGSADSLALLAAVYRDGLLTQADPMKAYAYMDAYAKATNDPTAAQQAAQMFSFLREADRMAALELQRHLLDSVKK